MSIEWKNMMMPKNYEIANIQNFLTFEQNFNIIGTYGVFLMYTECF